MCLLLRGGIDSVAGYNPDEMEILAETLGSDDVAVSADLGDLVYTSTPTEHPSVQVKKPHSGPHQEISPSQGELVC